MRRDCEGNLVVLDGKGVEGGYHCGLDGGERSA